MGKIIADSAKTGMSYPPWQNRGGLDKQFLLSQQFKYSSYYPRLFEAAFAKKWKALIRLESLESLNAELVAKRSNCRILAESAQSAASLGHHFFQLREF